MLTTLDISTNTNRLLAGLPRKDYVQLLANCELVELTLAQELNRPGEPISYVYFPIDSFISMVLPSDDMTSLEVRLVGNEGMFGITLILGVDIVKVQAVVQGPGTAWRITTALFLEAFEKSAALQRQLKRYLFVSFSQVKQIALCNRFHVLDARLARWLLMTHDRSGTDTFYITHASLGTMLGVRRVGITNAASSLQRRKIINYKRGEITILDRPALETVSCPCYRNDKDTYQQIME